MKNKIISLDQVAGLHEGDILERFPCNCDDGPAERFDATRTRHILKYKIRSINSDTKMFYLISGNFGIDGYAAPVTIGRLFIRDTDLIAEKIWWVTS